MENLLFVLALAGILLGGYSLFLPSLKKRGMSLPLMHLLEDDDDDIPDIGDDLDRPLDMNYAEKQNKREKQPKPARVKEPKAPKAPRGKKSKNQDDSLIPERFITSASQEMAPLPARTRRNAAPGEEEEIDPNIVFEQPNAGKALDEELDPELQALVDSTAQEDAATEAVAVAPVEAPAAEEKPAADLSDDILSLFDEAEVVDNTPAALRDAIELCSIEELQEEAAAMRSILAGLGSGQHAA